MTIAASGPTYVQIPGNGVATNFAFPFKIFSITDLVVGFITSSGYSLQASGYAVQNIDVNGGGNVVFTTAPPTGTTVDLRSLTTQIQNTEFANLGAFLPEAHTEAFDRVTREIQDLYRLTYLFGIHGPDQEDAPWPSLPVATARANGYLAFSALGLPIVVPSVSTVNYTYPVTQAENNAGVVPTNLNFPELDPRRYGAFANGTTDDKTAWHLADLVSGGTRSIIPPISSGLTYIGSALTLASPIQDTLAQIFVPNGNITLSGCPFLRPEWFGTAAGNIRYACLACGPAGGTVKLENKTYPPSFNTATGDGSDVPNVDYLANGDITLWGVGTPTVNSTFTGYTQGSGTIVQGPFSVFANGFHIKGGIGFDSSAPVCTALYAGVAQNGFAHYQPNKTAPLANTSNFHIDSISAIGQAPTSEIHSVLIEATSNGTVDEAYANYSYHGVVNKSINMKFGTVVAAQCGSDGFYMLSESYANGVNCQVDDIRIAGLAGTSVNGVLIQGDSANLSDCQIGHIRVDSCTTGVYLGGGGDICNDVQIGDILASNCTDGLVCDAVLRASVGKLFVESSTNACRIPATQTDKNFRVGEISGTALTGSLMALNGPMRVGNWFADGVTGYVANYAASGARLLVEGTGAIGAGGLTGGFANIMNPNTPAPALSGSWVNYGSGQNPFNVFLADGKVQFNGLIKSGVAAALFTLDSRVAPALPLQLNGQMLGGSTYAPAAIGVLADGVVTCTNYAGATSWLTLDGVSYPIPY